LQPSTFTCSSGNFHVLLGKLLRAPREAPSLGKVIHVLLGKHSRAPRDSFTCTSGSTIPRKGLGNITIPSSTRVIMVVVVMLSQLLTERWPEIARQLSERPNHLPAPIHLNRRQSSQLFFDEINQRISAPTPQLRLDVVSVRIVYHSSAFDLNFIEEL